MAALAAHVGAESADGELGATSVTGVTLDSQDVQPGDLFAALPGAKAHGAQFAGQALAAGAVAVLTDVEGSVVIGDADVPVLVHPAPRSVLGAAAAAVYGNPSQRLRVIGVTGTSGKTTTTYLIESALRSAGRRAGFIGTVGIRVDGVDQPSALTTPEAPALQALLAVMVERQVETVVMEVSSHALALGRVDGVQFSVAGFTNLSRDHLDFHQTMADYLDAKARLFDAGSPLRAETSVVCIDDEAGRAIAARAVEPITVSAQGDDAAWRAVAARTLPGGGQSFVAIDPAGARHELTIGLPGRYNVTNCVLAAAILDVVGLTPELAAAGLGAARVPGRLERIDGGQSFLALVDYAHKPGALRALLEAVRADGSGRVAVVFGAGGDRDAGKRAPMGRVAAELADLVVVTDDNPRSEDPAAIRAAILSGAREFTEPDGSAAVLEICDRRAAIRHAVGWAHAGDVVVIAGKGHESGQTAGGTTRPFDDREELAAALTARSSGA